MSFEQVLVGESSSAHVAEERFLLRLLVLAILCLVVDPVQGERFTIDELPAANFALEHFLLSVLAPMGP